MSTVNRRRYELYVEFVDDELQQTQKVFIEAGEALTPLTGLSPTEVEKVLSPDSLTLLIDSLSMKAEIDFSRSTKNTVSKIEVINLSKESRDKIARKNNKVVLKAGYTNDEELSIIFVGQVIYAETKRHGQDIITTLVIDEGFAVRESARITRSWSPKTYYSTIIKDLIDELVKTGLARGHTVLDVETSYKQPAPQFKWALGGFTCDGFIEDILKDICENMFGLEFFIYNGKINITPFESLETVSTLNIKENQIKTMAKSTNTKGGTKSTDKKFTLNTFLIGGIDTSDKVSILTGDYEGDYKILSIKYKLDYLGRDWDTILELEAI